MVLLPPIVLGQPSNSVHVLQITPSIIVGVVCDCARLILCIFLFSYITKAQCTEDHKLTYFFIRSCRQYSYFFTMNKIFAPFLFRHWYFYRAVFLKKHLKIWLCAKVNFYKPVSKLGQDHVFLRNVFRNLISFDHL